MPCDCRINLTVADPSYLGLHHHVMCPKYKTEVNPILFYWEEGVDAWCPVPEKTEHLVVVEEQLDEGEDMELRFKRFDMTDEQFANLPES